MGIHLDKELSTEKVVMCGENKKHQERKLRLWYSVPGNHANGIMVCASARPGW